ncbi:hypothetical protein [Massilia yuzhufengensis]|uniref:Uncharacterized protein n=1 Tax=Massilia yuzhufengensis TaxID=1164594 RepID=A0A1I1I6Y9_9BURK|nr:hypothetical protein [Massilia yuzhufengensis]SFC31964.1 hypothetical protein SAMN05216204_105110 [Massilia yuzhufengensis]
MKELFLSECRRFRTVALVAATIHLVLQLMASRMTEPLQMGWREQTVILIACAVAGLAFAVAQFSTHRQASRWLWLMHRPLPRSRIFGALALASLALLVAAIGLPALLAVLGSDRLTGRTVDSHHYLIPLHLLLTSFSAWLGGAYLMLSGRRSAFVVLFVPALLCWHLAAADALLAPALLAVALMAALAYTAFAPDRTAPPSTTSGWLAAGVPLVLGCHFVLLWGASIAFQSGQMLLGVNPFNSPLPPSGGAIEMTRADGRANLQRVLAASSDARAAHWRRQVALLDTGSVRARWLELPVRGQVGNFQKLQWFDNTRNIIWTFSHDRMLFEGRDAHTDAPRGWIGMGGLGDLRPFSAVPAMDGKYLQTAQQLLQIDPETHRIHLLASVAAPETLAGPVQEVGRQPFVLTNRRLVSYRAGVAPAGQPAPLEQVYSVPLPGPFGDLDRVDVARLLDGTLLSFNFGRRMIDGEVGSRQHLVFVDGAGRAQTVAVREVGHDFPLLFEHKDWWLSPVIHAALALPERLLDKGLTPDAPGTVAQQRPAAVVAAALVAAILSAALAAWRLRRHPRRQVLAWSAAALVFGAPCVAALWVLAPRLPRAASAAARAPAPLPVPATA